MQVGFARLEIAPKVAIFCLVVHPLMFKLGKDFEKIVETRENNERISV